MYNYKEKIEKILKNARWTDVSKSTDEELTWKLFDAIGNPKNFRSVEENKRAEASKRILEEEKDILNS